MREVAHPLVRQLRFARSELVRCLEGVSEEDAVRRLPPMNCLSWIVGHLANHDHRNWVVMGLGQSVAPGLEELVGGGRPASTPPLAEMWAAWRAVTRSADPYLDGLTTARLRDHLEAGGRRFPETIGTMLLRLIYHYWFHIGEAHAIRQALGHPDLPEFVGDMAAARYEPD